MSEVWIGPRALAKATGVSPDTLRHYERLGLLPGITRTLAGYRRYPPGLIDRVRVIQQALAVGFSLKDLASVLHQRDRGGSPPCRRVRALVGERLEELDQRLAELTALRHDMETLLRDWDRRLAQTPVGQRARLLDMLGQRAAIGRTAWPTPRRRKRH
jgi:MerR family transcriptional regulator, Zn(II)-responsive regulator of zntA